MANYSASNSPPYDKRKMEEFKRVYKESGSYDFISQVPYLRDLAEYYEKRFKSSNHWADAVKAHGLYNSCASRDGKALWSERAFAIQTLYWDGSVKLSYQDQLKITEALMRKLERVRLTVKTNLLDVKEASEEKAIIHDVCETKDLMNILQETLPWVMRKSNEMMVEVARTVMKHAVDLVTEDETFQHQICVVGFGSIARDEATPYSDLEFMFLIPDGNGLDRQIYEKISVTSYFLIANIGETPIKCFEIQELGIGKQRWFQDNTKSGFKFDGMQAQAGHIPTGNEYMYNEGRNYYIGTVDEMTERYNSVHENPNLGKCMEGDFSTMMSSLIYIYGEEPLLTRLREHILSNTPSERRHIATKQMLESDTQKFDFGPDYTLRQLKSAKRDFYRYASIICFDLKFYFNLNCSRALDVITKLFHMKKISEGVKNSLQTIYLAAQYIRQASYAHYDSQREEITVEFTRHTTHNERIPWKIPQCLLSLFLTHLLPLKRQVSDSMNDMKILLEDRELSHTRALSFTKYFCGDYRGFLNLLSSEDTSMTSSETDFAMNEMKIISLIHCNEHDEAKHMLEKCIKNAKDSECRKARVYSMQSDLSIEAGDYRKALENCEKALLTRLQIYGDVDHPDIATSYSNIATVYQYQGDFRKALDNHKKALSTRLKVYGDVDHPDIATSYNNIATVYRHQGDSWKALKNYEKSLSIRLKVYGDVDHPDIATTYSNIAIVYQDQGHYRKALDNHEKALSTHLKVYRDVDHSDTATSYNNIASVYRCLGDYSKALENCEKALAIRLRVYGDVDHPDIAASCNNIASVYRCLGDYSKALVNCEKALSIRLRVYGDVDHPDIATSYNNIASVYRRLGDYSKALENCEKALSIRLRVYGDVDHPDIATSCKNIASVYRCLGDYSKALENCEKALSISLRIYQNVDHPLIGTSYSNVAAAYQFQGYYRKALENYEKALSTGLKVYGDVDHPDIATSYSNIATVYQDLGDYKKALALSARLNIYKDAHHPHIATSYNNIATIYIDQRDFQRALENYEKALSANLKVYEDVDHPDIATSYNNIASVYRKQGDYKKALDNHEKALSIRLKCYGDAKHPHIATSYNNIAMVYEDLGDYRKALDNHEKALSIRWQVYGDVDHPEVGTSCENIAECKSEAEKAKKALSNYKKSESTEIAI